MIGWKAVMLALVTLMTLSVSLVAALSPDPRLPADIAQLSEAAPRLEPLDQVVDFEEISEGEEATVRFRIRNGGSADLRVGPIQAESVRAYCGLPDALKASGPITVIAPGGAGDIVATFKSEGFSGLIERAIHVYSNDLSRPKMTFWMRGRVQPVLRVAPRQLVLGVLYKSDYPWKLPTAGITPRQGIEVTKIESNSPYVRPALTRLPSDPNGTASLTIDVDPEVPVGDLHVELTLFTNHPTRTKEVIPVSGEVREDREITALPQLLDFGLIRPAEEMTRRVVLSRGNSDDWKPLRAEVEARGATVGITFHHVKPNWEIAVSVRPTHPLEGFRGVVHVVTDNANHPRVTIPLLGWTHAVDPAAVPLDQLKQFVVGILNEEYLQNSREVLKALGGIDDQRAFAVMASIIEEGESQPWIRGAGGLAGLGQGAWLARVRAVELLAALAHPEAAARLEAAARNDPDGVVRMEAVQGLFTLVPKRALSTLLHALDDEAVWVRMIAAELLGQLGDQLAIPALLRAMEDEQPEVQLSAAHSLEKIVEREGALVRTPEGR